MALAVLVILTLAAAGMILLPAGTTGRRNSRRRRGGASLRWHGELPDGWRDYFAGPRNARRATAAALESLFAAPSARR